MATSNPTTTAVDQVEVHTGTVPYAHAHLSAHGVTGPTQTSYRIAGPWPPSQSTDAPPPLVVLHGGPGVPHGYLVPCYDLLAAAGQKRGPPRTVIYYDQLGCGASTRLREKKGDEAFWTVDLFVAELDNLVRALGLADLPRGFDVAGHSWGGILACAYAVAVSPSGGRWSSAVVRDPRPANLRRVVLSSSTPSLPLWSTSTRRLLAAMPDDIREPIERGEETGEFETPEFEQAITEFYKKHLCRIEPFPDALAQALADMAADDTVYRTMNGPSEITVVGAIKDLDITEDIKAIKNPALIIHGELDESTDEVNTPFFENIDKVKWVTISGGAHIVHLEQPDKFLDHVVSFLG